MAEYAANSAATESVRQLVQIAFPQLERQLYRDHVRALSDKSFTPQTESQQIGEYFFSLSAGADISHRTLRISKGNAKPIEFLLYAADRSDGNQTITPIVAAINNQAPLEVKGIENMSRNFTQVQQELLKTQRAVIDQIRERDAARIRGIMS